MINPLLRECCGVNVAEDAVQSVSAELGKEHEAGRAPTHVLVQPPPPPLSSRPFSVFGYSTLVNGKKSADILEDFLTTSYQCCR
jgi:hypothetical protein